MPETLPDTAPPGATNPWGVVGQDDAVEALRRAIASGNLAHGYLITGPEGIGKGTLARRLAQTLVSPSAEDPTVPDVTTRIARQIEAGEMPDIERIATRGMCDESSHDHLTDTSVGIRICQVRRMERVASLAPFASPRRIFVVDSANDLQEAAAHSLLKTLEEPPNGVLILLLSTDPDALLPTIRSRCQVIPLRPAPYSVLLAALSADEEIEAPETLARLAHGRYGLAMRMKHDPTFAVLRETATTEARRLARSGRNERFDYAERMGGAWYRERESVLQSLDLWREWWRDVLVAAADADADVPPEAMAEATRCTPADALRALRAVQTAREHLLVNTHAQLALEVMMLDLPVLTGDMPAGTKGEREPVTAD